LEVPPPAADAAPVVAAALASAAAVAWFDAYFGVPLILVVLLATAALFTWLTGHTVFGRHLYAIGGSAEAARRAGVNVTAIRVAVFALASGLAAVGGLLSASRQFAVSIGTGGGTLLLEAIAAAVIGGTSLFGGRGQVFQALLGALVIGSVSNGLDLLGQPSSTKNIATGVILVFAVAVDALGRRQRPGS
ncbi:MAG TPA: ABC transporter permease, partial [Deinococcales bacterium]|nr:ABC transporter permease [Deinococcales bacterium]